MSFEIGNVKIHDIAAFNIEQQYQEIGGEEIFRAASGRGIKQFAWQRTRVVTSGSGWIATGLGGLDYTQQQVLKCIVPRNIDADIVTRQATLPAARRNDGRYVPYGIAIMSDGQAVTTSATMVGNVATLAAVAGAVAYQTCYFPQLTVWALRPSASGNRGDATHRWDLVCEEV